MTEMGVCHKDRWVKEIELLQNTNALQSFRKYPKRLSLGLTITEKLRVWIPLELVEG